MALAAGDLPVGMLALIIYDGTQFQLVNASPSGPTPGGLIAGCIQCLAYEGPNHNLPHPRIGARTWPEFPTTASASYDSGDEDVFAEFYKERRQKRLDHIRMKFPGDKRHEPDFLASPHYQQRFPRQWEAYQGAGRSRPSDRRP